MTRITKRNPRAERLIFSAKAINVHTLANGFVAKPLPAQCISPGAWAQGRVAYCTPAEYVWALFTRALHSYIYWNRDGWTVHIHGNEWYDLQGAAL